MRTFLTAILFLAIMGCGSMTNDQIIQEVNKCKAAGLKPEVIQNGWDYSVIRVQCEPTSKDSRME